MSHRGSRAGVPVQELFSFCASVDTAWMRDAACRRSTDPELFFPVSEIGPGVRLVNAAKAVCAACPVRVACLTFALERDVEGVWGGTTEGERRALRAADRRVA